MKVTWERKDIKCGLRLGSYNHNEQSMIGYRVGENGNEYSLISLADGMILFSLDKEGLAERFNNMELVPLVLLEVMK